MENDQDALFETEKALKNQAYSFIIERGLFHEYARYAEGHPHNAEAVGSIEKERRERYRVADFIISQRLYGTYLNYCDTHPKQGMFSECVEVLYGLSELTGGVGSGDSQIVNKMVN